MLKTLNLLYIKIFCILVKNIKMNELFIKNYNEYLKYCYSLTKHIQDAEDLLHDAYLKLYQYTNKYNNTDVNKSFIYVVIKNVHLDNFRKNKNITILNDYDLSKIEDDVSKILELRYKVVRICNTLEEVESGLLLDSRSERRISRESGVPIRKIKTIITNAKEKFKRKWLEEENQKGLEM